ncbi:hypothetical protein [Paenibacillus thalictri]|uniref:Multi antimicrobial extrusion protein MatE n=1 Tax=Paenibacillus thalictri TaxID=2527873 RepID=A0A4Q9DUJ3_9BACL|nr:hypothetical protein [Paenibacillus thalictri]TBL80674.1 hypothetical protein EYB31_05455 [Paenibacillus thalictri]
MRRIILFYVPMGISSMLAGLTHIIINGVLARAEHPEAAISSYAVALSLSFLLDLPMNALRQTSSRYALDRVSFRSVARLTCWVAGSLLAASAIIAFTPAGAAIFRYLFGVREELLAPTVQVYQVLAIMYGITSLRSLFQGVIINRLRTGWMTIGMAVRVVVMLAMSWYFVRNGVPDDGRIGALIFMVGLLIECAVAVTEGRSLRKKLPERQELHYVENIRELLPFYVPLLYSSLATAVLQPSIQISLNLSANPTLSVASYAVAIQLSNMVAWFCSSVHQIVIHFYMKERRNVLIIVSVLSLFSPVLLLAVSTDAGGNLILGPVLGMKGALMEDVKMLLRFFAVQSLLFPWLDFLTGISMLKGRTKAAMIGKISSVALSIAILIAAVWMSPQLNGRLAGLAIAAAAPVELLIVFWTLRRMDKPARMWARG